MAIPINPADYRQGWWTYTYSAYNFSNMLPEDWVVEETTTFGSLMSGHALNLHPNYGNENIRMTFRRAGEDVLLWPTGMGQGEFIQQGIVDIAGQPARRIPYEAELPESNVQVRMFKGLNHRQEFEAIDQVLPVILDFVRG